MFDTMNKAIGFGFAIGATSILGGCFSAQSFMHGGDIVGEEMAQGAKRHYRYESCRDGSGKAFVPASMKKQKTYHVVDYKGRLGLYEHATKGPGGSVTTNQWEAEDGTHFLSWVRNAGWEYIIPREADKPATKLLYNSFHPKKEGGVTKADGPPDAGTCVLVQG